MKKLLLMFAAVGMLFTACNKETDCGHEFIEHDFSKELVGTWTILEEGQAEAILKVQNAKAEGLRMLKEAGADAAVLRLKSLEAFEKAADGKATKIIIPSEIQSIAGLASSLQEIVTTK